MNYIKEDFSSLEGHGIADAESKLYQAGIAYEIRVVKYNGQSCAVTDDFRFDRINVELENEIITYVQGIG